MSWLNQWGWMVVWLNNRWMGSVKSWQFHVQPSLKFCISTALGGQCMQSEDPGHLNSRQWIRYALDVSLIFLPETSGDMHNWKLLARDILQIHCRDTVLSTECCNVPRNANCTSVGHPAPMPLTGALMCKHYQQKFHLLISADKANIRSTRIGQAVLFLFLLDNPNR